MANVLKLQNVKKQFGSTQAMDNISLEVSEGVVFALLGENGAGKTTTIKTLLGLELPDSGSVDVLGMNPSKQSVDIRRAIGYVPENPVLYDWMTVSQIAWFTSGFYPDGFTEKFSELAKEFDLPTDKKIKSLSKGGRAKVALALAMAHQPRLLILDEPTSGLDTMVRRKFLESMVDVAAEGRTVLLSSHQIPEVERVADWVAIVHEGRVLVCDTLENLKAKLERWVVTFEDTAAQLPEMEARILTHEGRGSRRQQLFVREPGPNALWRLRDHPGVNEVEVHTPSLEEIFVAYVSRPELVDDQQSEFSGQQDNTPAQTGEAE